MVFIPTIKFYSLNINNFIQYIMAYGKIEYDDEGKPICEICGESFKRVTAHARQKHSVSAREYKQMFGLDLRKGICSRESRELSRERLFENYDVSVKRNLLKKGSKSRFKVGSKGRTKDQISEQTLLRLKEGLNNPKMKKAMEENGRRVGKSGLGNLKRWSSKH